MTNHEAYERAARIWSQQRIISVWRRRDGGADVHLYPAGTASDVRERNHSAHRLDANGHTACHADCAGLEQEGCP